MGIKDQVRLNIFDRGKQVSLDVREVTGIHKAVGLMFRDSTFDILYFDFGQPKKNSIHSYFVNFPFLAVWIDKKNNVIKKEIIYPNNPNVRPERAFSGLIEIPINKQNKETVRALLDFEEFRKIYNS